METHASLSRQAESPSCKDNFGGERPQEGPGTSV